MCFLIAVHIADAADLAASESNEEAIDERFFAQQSLVKSTGITGCSITCKRGDNFWKWWGKEKPTATRYVVSTEYRYRPALEQVDSKSLWELADVHVKMMYNDKDPKTGKQSKVRQTYLAFLNACLEEATDRNIVPTISPTLRK